MNSTTHTALLLILVHIIPMVFNLQFVHHLHTCPVGLADYIGILHALLNLNDAKLIDVYAHIENLYKLSAVKTINNKKKKTGSQNCT